jgi:microcystin-dependent protein
MAYNPVNDFIALLRTTSGGVRSARMPGLDFIIEGFIRAGLILVSVSQTAPTVNQSQTVWFRPAVPSWSGEGTVNLFNPATGTYQPATPALWALLLSGAAPTNVLPLPDATPGVVGVSLAYARADHVHPTDVSRAPLASPVFTGTPQAPTPALGDSSQLVATTGFVQNTVGTVVPIGGVIAFAGNTAPTNFALLNGQAISRTTFATLFGLPGVGITYGSGDGVTTFNLPDMRGRVIAGVDGGANRLTAATMTSQALAGTGGAEVQTLTAAQIPAHNHGTTETPHTHNVTQLLATISSAVAGSALQILGNSGSAGGVVTNSASTGLTVNNSTGGGGSHINVQPTMQLNYAIRVA